MFIEILYLVPFALLPVAAIEFSLSLVEASLLISIPSLLGLLANVPAGFLADRLRVNRLLFFSVFLEGIAMLLVSQTNSFIALLLFLSLTRIALPFYHASGLGCLARITKREHMNKLAGFHNALGNVGQAIGVITLSLCLLSIGWRWAYLIWAFPVLFWSYVILMSLKVEGERAKVTKTTNQVKRSRWFSIFPSLFLFLLAFAIKEVGSIGAMTFMSTYFVEIRNLSVSTASLILAIGPFIGVAGSLAGGHLGDRLGSKKALSYIMIFCALSLLAVSMVEQLLLLVLSYVVYSLFNSSAWPPINAMVADTAPPGSKGLGFSLCSLAEGVIASLAPIFIAGIVEFTGNLWLVFPISASFIGASVAILLLLSYKHVFDRK